MANPGTNIDTTDQHDEQRVMHIRFEQGNESRVREVLAALDSGETPDQYLERVYHDPSELHRVTRPKNLELLQTLARGQPASIRETARLVERDVRQVHRNLEELAELGLVKFEEEGRSKRPVVWYDEIDVELLLHEPDTSTDHASV